MPKQIVTLQTLGEGMASELFQHELRKIFENMQDPNTNPTAKRSVTLKVTVAPFKDRSGAEVLVDCSSKIAPIPAQDAGRIFLHRENGKLEAMTSDVRQEDLFEEPKPLPENVVPMNGTK